MKVRITNVENLTTSEELDGLLQRFEDIDEIEMEALTPFVMQYFLESFAAGNEMEV